MTTAQITVCLALIASACCLLLYYGPNRIEERCREAEEKAELKARAESIKAAYLRASQAHLKAAATGNEGITVNDLQTPGDAVLAGALMQRCPTKPTA